MAAVAPIVGGSFSVTLREESTAEIRSSPVVNAVRSVLLGAVVLVVVARGRGRLRAVLVAVLTAGLLGPWVVRFVTDPARLLAGWGAVTDPGATDPLEPLRAGGPSWTAGLALCVLALLAFGGLATSRRPGPLGAAVALVALGTAVALVAPRILLAGPEPVRPWSGTGWLVATAGALALGLLAADEALRPPELMVGRAPARTTRTAALVAAGVPVAALVGWGAALRAEPVLAPRVEDGAEPSAQQIEQARDIIVQRVDSQGVSGAEVTTRGGSSIVVTMPGTPSQRTVDAIRASSQMQFRPVFFIGPGSPEPAPAGTSPTEGSAKKGSTSSTTTKRPSSTSAPGGAAGNHAPLPAETSPSTTKASSTKDSSTGSGTAPVPASEAKPKKDDPLDPSWVTPAVVEQFVALDCAKETSRKAVRGGSDKAIVACSRDGEMKYILGPVAISGDQIKDASAGFRTNQQGQTTNEPEIALSFNDDATAAYRDLSRRMVQLPQPGASQAPAPLNALATVLDGEVLIAPGFNEPIPNGQASVTGGFTIQEARDLARSLKFGALPISFDLDGRSTISPTLGSEQLRYGLWAGLIGLVLVVTLAGAQRGLCCPLAGHVLTVPEDPPRAGLVEPRHQPHQRCLARQRRPQQHVHRAAFQHQIGGMDMHLPLDHLRHALQF